jgi:hypothetical protein
MKIWKVSFKGFTDKPDVYVSAPDLAFLAGYVARTWPNYPILSVICYGDLWNHGYVSPLETT